MSFDDKSPPSFCLTDTSVARRGRVQCVALDGTDVSELSNGVTDLMVRIGAEREQRMMPGILREILLAERRREQHQDE